MLMCKQPDILESEKIHFAVMAIEAGAREMGFLLWKCADV